MSKICTDIEQSKKLIELGIDLNTADMYWWNCHGFRLSANPYTEEVKKGFESHQLECIPAWSLSALLEILRNYTDCDKLDIFSNRSQKWQITISYYDHVWKEHEEVSINLMESTYNTVVWLLDNNFYK